MRILFVFLLLSILNVQFVYAEDENEIDFKNLKEILDNQLFYVLDHPQVECYVKNLISERDFDILSSRINSYKAQNVLLTKDSSGGYVFDGLYPHSGGCESGIIWVHPNGSIIGGYVENCHPPHLFTNDNNLKQNLPVAVSKWINKHANSGKPVWLNARIKQRIQPACSKAKLKDSISEYMAGMKGDACNKYTQIDFKYKMINPEKDNKAFFFLEPVECTNSDCSHKEESYLVLGDIVIIRNEKNGFSCVDYTNKNGKKIGWVSNKDILNFDIQVNNDNYFKLKEGVQKLSKEASGWFGVSTKDTLWEGYWESSSNSIGSSFKIQLNTDSKLSVAGDAWRGYNVGQIIDGVLELDGRIAYLEPENDLSCGAIFLYFNNAILVFDNYGCGGYGVSFSGIHIHKTLAQLD